jgi:hypothetical protein
MLTVAEAMLKHIQELKDKVKALEDHIEKMSCNCTNKEVKPPESSGIPDLDVEPDLKDLFI